jgi:hypothetical protein
MHMYFIVLKKDEAIGGSIPTEITNQNLKKIVLAALELTMNDRASNPFL